MRVQARGVAQRWSIVLTGIALACSASRVANAATPNHVVVVVEENRDYGDIIGSAAAPFLNQLAHGGLLFTNSHANEHPSQPDYLDLFSGSNQGVTDSLRHPPFTAANLASNLRLVGRTFAGYSQSLPNDGFDGDAFPTDAPQYVRRHNPFTQFADLTIGGTNAAVNKAFNSANFPIAPGTDYSRLPDVSFIVPDVLHDMHEQPQYPRPDSGVISEGDNWLRENLGSYATWAATHRSLLVVTWDEGLLTPDNHIATIVTGDPSLVRPGVTAQRVNHFNLLRTIEDLYYTKLAGASSTAAPFAHDAAGALIPDTVWGDVDRSGAVDFADLLVAGQHFGATQSMSWPQGDLTGDGRVDLSDLLLVAQNYGRRVSDAAPAAVMIPEPSAAALAAALLLPALSAARRAQPAKHRRPTFARPDSAQSLTKAPVAALSVADVSALRR